MTHSSAAEPVPGPAELARQATAEILASLDAADRGVVVDSPPGAGKSALVVTAAAQLADAGEPVMVIAQTNEQVDDLTARLAAARPGLRIGRISGREYTISPRLARPQVTVSTAMADLTQCPVITGTAHKWATISD